MPIVKWSPLYELDAVERRMRRMLEDLGLAPGPLPAADVYETDDELVVELEVPGYEEKEIGIEVSDHVLVVRGERSETKEAKEKAFRLHERLERQFERRFELPPQVDPERVSARFANGVLEIHAGKAALPKARRIDISRA